MASLLVVQVRVVDRRAEVLQSCLLGEVSEAGRGLWLLARGVGGRGESQGKEGGCESDLHGDDCSGGLC